ncbi:MAG: insulinase family protein [Balneolaceae bacterium]|nr:insulinase family protein [Balneolaceae bacterium]
MKRLIILSFVMMFSLSLMAQKRYDEIEYPELNEIETPAIEEFSLDNGIKFYLVEDHELPLVNVRILVQSGSILEPKSKTGLASMTGTVMRSGGSENYPADKLNKLLEDNAANLSTYLGFSSGGASLNVLKEDFDDILPVFVDVLQNPAFPEDKVDLAKTQTKSGISRRNDNQQAIGSREFRDLIYGENSIYTQQTEYETVNNISQNDLINFHKDAFVGNNMMIGIVGDFNTEEMKQKLEEAFSSFPAGEETNIIFPEVNYDYPVTINFVDKPDVNQSFVTLGHIGGLRENPDYPAIQVMNQVLGGGFSGRLFQKVRTELGLAYSVGGGYRSNINYPGSFQITTMTKSSTTAEAIDAIIEEIERMKTEPPTEEKLQETKDQFLNSLVFRSVSKSQILNRQMNNEYNGLSPEAFNELIEGIKATTPADVQSVAKKYLRPDKLQILVVGNKEEIGDQLDKYGNINELDISIPQPPAEKKEQEAGDANQGKEWLAKMAEAVIEAGTEVTSIAQTGSQTIVTPQGAVDIPGTITNNYAEDKVKAILNAPQGTIEMTVQDGKGTQKMAGQEFPMPPASVKQIQQELERDYINIALSYASLEAEYLGKESIDGTEYVKLRVNFDTPVTYYLDPATNLPNILTYEQFNPRLGKSQQVKTTYSNWKTVDGVTFAFTVESTADGEKTSSQSIESIEVNKEN